MNRTQKILVFVLVAQAALAVALFWPRPAPAGAGGALLPEVKADEITSLAVADAQGNGVKLAKSGAQWVLPDAGDYPADAAKIVPILTKLVEMKANRLVAQTPAAQRRLQVADDAFSRRIEVGTPAGAKTVYVGTSGGGGSSHVRLGGQDQVYLVSGVTESEFGADAASWTNPAYLVVPQADVVEMNLRNANGEWSFVRGADGQWTLQGLASGETLNAQSVNDLLGAASYIRLARPLGKVDDAAYGLSQPNAVVTLITKADSEQKSYTLTIGAQDPSDKTYAVKSSESPYFVRVDEYSLKDLVEKTREGFLTLPPTAVPAPTQPAQ
jgi:Domain of unknown function (DUF4340)